MTAVLGAIARAISAIKKAVKAARKTKRTVEKLNKYKKGIVTAVVVVFLLVVAPVAAFMGGVTEIRNLICSGFFNWVSGGEEEVLRHMNDAYYMMSMLDKFENSEDGSIRTSFYNMNASFNQVDVETYKEILSRVNNYNKVFNGFEQITTQKRKETGKSPGDFPQIGPRTGELIVPYVQSKRVVNVNGGLIINGQGIVTRPSVNANKDNDNDYSKIEEVIENNNKNNASIGNGSPQVNPSGWVSGGVGTTVTGGGLMLGSGIVPATTPAPSVDSGEDEETQDSEPEATPAPTDKPEPNHKIDYENVGNGANGSQYTAGLGDLIITRSSIEDKWDNGPDRKHQKMDYLNWQPIVALCCYYSTVTANEWGTYGESGTRYIPYSKIQEIIDIFAFEYTYVQEVPHTANRIMWEDYLKGDKGISPFKTTVTGPYQDGRKWYRMTERTPAYAPAKIANSYICYEYVYDRGTEIPIDGWRVDYSYIKEVKYHIQPERLIEAIEKVVPQFDETMYLYMLRKLPNGEEFAKYFEEEIFPEEKHGLHTVSTTVKEDSPSIDVVTGSKNYSDYVNGYFDVYEGSASGSGLNFEDGGYAIPLYAAEGSLGGTYLHIRPLDELMVEGTDYGMYYLSAAAMAPLDVSDELSYIDILRLLNDPQFLNGISTSPLLDEETYPGVRESFAACLYNFQENYQSSICGLLGIMKQEGGFTSGVTKNGWNYFNIEAGKNKGIDKYPRFRDYKHEVQSGEIGIKHTLYSAEPVKAFSMQMDFIYNLYWNGTRSGQKQNSFYKMIFVNYAKNGATGLQAYSMYPSYCPPYDDKAMPYSSDSYITTTDKNGNSTAYYFWRGTNITVDNHRGWANNCAWWRVKYYNLAKGTE